MRNVILFLFCIVTLTCCKKDEQSPDLQFKSGGTYVTGNITASPGSQIVVGVNAYKTTNDLHLFYTEVAYDGANTNMLVSRVWLNGDERSLYSKDITITLRNQTGTERWIFNVNDGEGRITKKEIRVSVQ